MTQDRAVQIQDRTLIDTYDYDRIKQLRHPPFPPFSILCTVYVQIIKQLLPAGAEKRNVWWHVNKWRNPL